MISLEDALTMVQSGLTAVAIVLILLFVRQQWRNRTRPPSPAEMVDVHDEICSIAPWPHAGYCCPTGGRDGVMARFVMLVALAEEGIGRVDTMTGIKIDRDGTTSLIQRREDEKCEGQD